MDYQTKLERLKDVTENLGVGFKMISSTHLRVGPFDEETWDELSDFIEAGAIGLRHEIRLAIKLLNCFLYVVSLPWTYNEDPIDGLGKSPDDPALDEYGQIDLLEEEAEYASKLLAKAAKSIRSSGPTEELIFGDLSQELALMELEELTVTVFLRVKRIQTAVWEIHKQGLNLDTATEKSISAL